MLTRQKGTAGLAPHEVDFLLGVHRSAADVARLRAAGIRYNAFYRFMADRMPAMEFRALWTQHGAFLRAEAKRRRITPRDPHDFGPIDQSGRAFWVARQERTRC